MGNLRNLFLFLFLAVYGILSEIRIPANVIAQTELSARGNIKNITFLGSNARHHYSLNSLKKIKEPFVLILIDAHSDSKPYSKEVQCGNWVNFAVRENSNIKKVIVMGVSKGLQFEDASLWNNYDLIKSGKLEIWPAKKCRSYFKDANYPPASGGLYSSYEFDYIGKFFGHPGYYVVWKDYKTLLRDRSFPAAYISIDLDVLREVKTSYGSGSLDTGDLLEIIKDLKKSEIIGVDICGTDDRSSRAVVEKITECFQEFSKNRKSENLQPKKFTGNRN